MGLEDDMYTNKEIKQMIVSQITVPVVLTDPVIDAILERMDARLKQRITEHIVSYMDKEFSLRDRVDIDDLVDDVIREIAVRL